MTRKARIAHLAGPNATIQNTPPLVTSNKAMSSGLPISSLHCGDGDYMAGKLFAPLEADFGGTTAQQQKAAEGEGVCGCHPLQAGLAEVQIAADRRQRRC